MKSKMNVFVITIAISVFLLSGLLYFYMPYDSESYGTDTASYWDPQGIWDWPQNGSIINEGGNSNHEFVILVFTDVSETFPWRSISTKTLDEFQEYESPSATGLFDTTRDLLNSRSNGYVFDRIKHGYIMKNNESNEHFEQWGFWITDDHLILYIQRGTQGKGR